MRQFLASIFSDKVKLGIQNYPFNVSKVGYPDSKNIQGI